jgi:cell division protein FtsX
MTGPKHILNDAPARGKIGKQIRLPLRKAVEISLKSLKVRFWRSMLTVSSIILAIAFLTYVLATSRVQSAVAVGIEEEAAKLLDVARAVDEAWAPLERELAKRFDTRRADYKAETNALYAGRTGRFKAFCVEVAADRKKPIDLAGLPADRAAVETLAARARAAGLEPDTEGWSPPALALAGVKGVVQAEVDRIGRVNLALQRAGIDPSAPVEKLRRLSPSAWWLIIISCLVCGVGITNAMLMSVTERFREIGTMKCLGALDSFIVKLFLLESTMQGLAGTLVGIALGVVVMLVMSLVSFGSAALTHFPVLDAALVVLWSVLIGAGLSVAGAILPALRAARMAPVEAMRADE